MDEPKPNMEDENAVAIPPRGAANELIRDFAWISSADERTSIEPRIPSMVNVKPKKVPSKPIEITAPAA